jgi:hypothetical protein
MKKVVILGSGTAGTMIAMRFELEHRTTLVALALLVLLVGCEKGTTTDPRGSAGCAGAG